MEQEARVMVLYIFLKIIESRTEAKKYPYKAIFVEFISVAENMIESKTITADPSRVVQGEEKYPTTPKSKYMEPDYLNDIPVELDNAPPK